MRRWSDAEPANAVAARHSARWSYGELDIVFASARTGDPTSGDHHGHRPTLTEIDWLADSSIGPYAAAFKRRLMERRYAAHTIASYLTEITHFTRWVCTRRLPLARIDEVSVTLFLDDHLPSCACTGQADRSVGGRQGQRCATCWRIPRARPGARAGQRNHADGGGALKVAHAASVATGR